MPTATIQYTVGAVCNGGGNHARVQASLNAGPNVTLTRELEDVRLPVTNEEKKDVAMVLFRMAVDMLNDKSGSNIRTKLNGLVITITVL